MILSCMLGQLAKHLKSSGYVPRRDRVGRAGGMSDPLTMGGVSCLVIVVKVVGMTQDSSVETSND
jgi:hypothetical protein